MDFKGCQHMKNIWYWMDQNHHYKKLTAKRTTTETAVQITRSTKIGTNKFHIRNNLFNIGTVLSRTCSAFSSIENGEHVRVLEPSKGQMKVSFFLEILIWSFNLTSVFMNWVQMNIMRTVIRAFMPMVSPDTVILVTWTIIPHQNNQQTYLIMIIS